MAGRSEPVSCAGISKGRIWREFHRRDPDEWKGPEWRDPSRLRINSRTPAMTPKAAKVAPITMPAITLAVAWCLTEGVARTEVWVSPEVCDVEEVLTSPREGSVEEGVGRGVEPVVD
jgi:hypothetical protein